MDRYGHQVFGANAGLAVAVVASLGPVQGLAFATVAAGFAGGPLSPDIDNQRWFRKLDGLVPDELLGNGGPLAHRGVLHWWGLEAIAAGLLLAAQQMPGAGYVAWIGWAIIVGWLSHLVGDWAFGLGHVCRVDSPELATAGVGARRRTWTGRDGGQMVTVRGAGIPMAPWWAHRGLGRFHSGGRTNRVVTVLGHFTALPLAYLLLRGGVM